jgi:hypothetical protein
MNQEVEKTKKNKRPAAAAFVRSFVRPSVRSFFNGSRSNLFASATILKGQREEGKTGRDRKVNFRQQDEEKRLGKKVNLQTKIKRQDKEETS